MGKAKQAIRLTAKFDGGNPRRASRIREDRHGVFTVRPTWDSDPDRSYGLAFAVMVENAGLDAATLTVNVDWGTPRHMEYKHVYYVNCEGEEDWTEIAAAVDGQVASVTFDAAPGVSYLSLSPMYNYSRYLAFMDALAQRPEADVVLAGKSREGREIWHVQIPPGATPDAEPVMFICRNNACESAGNFMIEGMVRFLFSGEPEATELMRRFTFHFLPMTNPDGAFNGLERDTARENGANLGRMNTAPDSAHDAIRHTLEAVRPGVFVNMHNWMIPDVDGLLCNDELYARRLSELLPPVGSIPRRYHREWYSDAITEVEDRGDVTLYPIAKLPELHRESGGTWKDFCRERFDARAMAVEFPWQGRTVDDMRQLGIALLKAVCLVRVSERGIE
ncbi:MAG TPA: M14 family zinc carboxypeptidase [Planctomycetota bacterium]|nr:M14 family zinc carboxypeptidase [Planctomycetota bacterium]